VEVKVKQGRRGFEKNLKKGKKLRLECELGGAVETEKTAF
jgi:hypothetical protein